MLQETHEWVRGAGKLSGIGVTVPFALFLHMLQLGRALQLLDEQGYADSGGPLVRSMVSTAVNMLAICREDSDAVALQYLAFSIVRRRKYTENFIKNGLLTPEALGDYEEKAAEREKEVLAKYAEAGVGPRRLGGDKRTWSGLTDADLFKYVDATPWYEVHYAPLSDDVHANVSAIAPELRGMDAGATTTGPRWTDPLLLLSASVDVVGHAMEELAKHLSHRPEEAAGIRKRAREAALTAISNAANEPR
jgi:hypothetical protein